MTLLKEGEYELSLVIQSYLDLVDNPEAPRISIQLLQRKIQEAGKMPEVERKRHIQQFQAEFCNFLNQMLATSYSAEERLLLMKIKQSLEGYNKTGYWTNHNVSLAKRIETKLRNHVSVSV